MRRKKGEEAMRDISKVKEVETIVDNSELVNKKLQAGWALLKIEVVQTQFRYYDNAAAGGPYLKREWETVFVVGRVG